MTSTPELLDRLYGPKNWEVRLRVKVCDDPPLTNKDLLSLAAVLDETTRFMTRKTLAELRVHLDIDSRLTRALEQGIDTLPSECLDGGQIIDFKRGSWELTLGLSDITVISTLVFLLSNTLGEDIRAVWQETALSRRMKGILLTGIPDILKVTATAMRSRIEASRRLGTRFLVRAVSQEVKESEKVVQVDVEVVRGQVITTERSVAISSGNSISRP